MTAIEFLFSPDIDDTYNSSPAACEAGLRMLSEIPFGKRKIAILGDMLELGKHTNDAHVEAGKLANLTADVLITVGPRAKEIARGAKEEGMSEKKIFSFDDAVAAGEYMRKSVKAQDIIYLKGSQGVRMERTVKMLMARPEQAAELLVRQEAVWETK